MAAQLIEAGVGIDGVRRNANRATATTLILSDAQHNRTAFYYAGANEAVDCSAISDTLLRRTKMLLLTSYPILPGLRPNGAVDLFQKARSGGTRTAVDIGPAIGEPARLDELRSLLPNTDFFICNEHELHVCTGETESAAEMAAIREGGAKCVVIKRGAAGATLLQPDDGGPTDVPGFAVNVHGTVGAGDTFVAGFLLAVQEGADPTEAARFANAAAAIVVSTPERPLDAVTRKAVSRLIESSPDC